MFKLLSLEEFICCTLSNKIICVNHVQRDALVKRGIPIEKITISLNVPDPKIFYNKNIRKKNPTGNDRLNLVYHGTVVKRLGVDLIIKAIARLVDEIQVVNLNIWGKSGDDLDEFIELSKILGVDNLVHFIRGGVPYVKLPSKLVHMDLGIVGNRKSIATELMLPVKMLEYIALDIPVVVPRLKGIEYYFSDEMVSYYEAENVDSMTNAILRLYQEKSLRKVQAEKARAFLDKFGWEMHKKDLINLYKEL